MTAAYRIARTHRDTFAVCACCGRTMDKRVIVLADRDGAEGLYGTACAGRLLSLPASRVWNDALRAERIAARDAARTDRMARFADSHPDLAARLAPFADAPLCPGAELFLIVADGALGGGAWDVDRLRRAMADAGI